MHSLCSTRGNLLVTVFGHKSALSFFNVLYHQSSLTLLCGTTRLTNAGMGGCVLNEADVDWLSHAEMHSWTDSSGLSWPCTYLTDSYNSRGQAAVHLNLFISWLTCWNFSKSCSLRPINYKASDNLWNSSESFFFTLLIDWRWSNYSQMPQRMRWTSGV